MRRLLAALSIFFSFYATVLSNPIAAAEATVAVPAVEVKKPTTTVSAAEIKRTQGRPFMWKVSGTVGGLYLLGSIHVAKADAYPLNPKIYSAFDESDMLAVEVLLEKENPEAIATQLVRLGAFPPGESLDQKIPPDLYQTVKGRMAALGVPEDALKRLRPWAVGVNLVAGSVKTLGYDPNLGIDNHFIAKAKEKKKPTTNLELAKDQLLLLAKLSEAEQVFFLRATVQELDSEKRDLDKIFALWQQGNAPALEAMIRPFAKDPSTAAMYKKLFDDRNIKMANELDEMMKTGLKTFVVVGAAHLVGPNGLVNILKKKYQVVQVQ